MSFAEKPKTVIQEDIVLNKFDGDVLLETVYLTNGAITRHDVFDADGNLVDRGQEV